MKLTAAALMFKVVEHKSQQRKNEKTQKLHTSTNVKEEIKTRKCDTCENENKWLLTSRRENEATEKKKLKENQQNDMKRKRNRLNLFFLTVLNHSTLALR